MPSSVTQYQARPALGHGCASAVAGRGSGGAVLSFTSVSAASSAHGTEASRHRTSLTVEYPFADVCIGLVAPIEHGMQVRGGDT